MVPKTELKSVGLSVPEMTCIGRGSDPPMTTISASVKQPGPLNGVEKMFSALTVETIVKEFLLPSFVDVPAKVFASATFHDQLEIGFWAMRSSVTNVPSPHTRYILGLSPSARISNAMPLSLKRIRVELPY